MCKPMSAEIPRPAPQAARQGAEIVYPVGDQVVHVTIGLQHTVHGQQRGTEDLGALHLLKRDLLLLRKSLWPLRDMLNGLQRGNNGLISDPTGRCAISARLKPGKSVSRSLTSATMGIRMSAAMSTLIT